MFLRFAAKIKSFSFFSLRGKHRFSPELEELSDSCLGMASGVAGGAKEGTVVSDGIHIAVVRFDRLCVTRACSFFLYNPCRVCARVCGHQREGRLKCTPNQYGPHRAIRCALRAALRRWGAVFDQHAESDQAQPMGQGQSCRRCRGCGGARIQGDEDGRIDRGESK